MEQRRTYTRMHKQSILWALFVVAITLQACLHIDPDPKYKIVFSQCTLGDEWRKEMVEAMEREMEFHPLLDLKVVDANNSSARQIRQIDSIAKTGIDLLIISPNESAPITPVVERIMVSGLPIIIVDRKTDSKLYTAYIGADNYEIGHTAAKYIKNLRMSESQTRILEIWGLEGSSPAQNRHKGFQAMVSTDDKLNIVGKVAANWEAEGVRKEFPPILESNLEFDVIFAHNDRMALEAYQMLKAYRPGYEAQIIGVDGLSGPLGGMQQVTDDIFSATLLYPHGGVEAIQLAEKILLKQPFEKDNILQTTIIDQNNVRIMKMQAEKLAIQQREIVRQQIKIKEQTQIYKDQTTALYILVFSLIAAIILGAVVYSSLKAKQEANLSLELKNQEILTQQKQIVDMAQKAEEATQAKLKFFTNISHEFRTPLTLVLAPLEDLLNSELKDKNQVRKDLSLMRKNTIRLLRLVSQLMDFRKIENNKMRIQASRQNLVLFVADIYETYKETAKGRGIQFTFQHKLDDPFVWFDANMIDKVLFNLLSNAFKFTPDGGKVWVVVNEKDGGVSIEVGDNGRGMSEEHVAHAFDRFYQGKQYKTQGTGLGLSLSQELIHLHQGTIEVESKKGLGTRFSILLKRGKEHFKESELSFSLDHSTDHLNSQILFKDEQEEEMDHIMDSSEQEDAMPSILLIEDHAELRAYLKSKLANQFKVLVAGDAELGIKLAVEFVPDLIVCDVMLPGQDGRSFTSALKQNMKTSHIPVILLTAQSSLNQQIKGLKSGADLYLTKPFSTQLLVENIHNLLKNRELLRENFGGGESIFALPTEPDHDEPNSLDKEFIHTFKALVSERISDSSFGVNDICHEMGLSRVQLYRKVKALMGYTVSDYIKELRLNIASKLLRQKELTVAEIAYQVGFASPAYFSTAFKSRYHISPTEYRSRQSMSS